MVEIRFVNKLLQLLMIYWYGLFVLFDQDGNLFDFVVFGGLCVYCFMLLKGSVGIYWYYLYLYMMIVEQVFCGLVGLFVVCVVDDLFVGWFECYLFVLDLKFVCDGMIVLNDMMDWMNGCEGQFVLVNGVCWLCIDVVGDECWWVWNVCSVCYLCIVFDDGCVFEYVGIDGGLFDVLWCVMLLLIVLGECVELLVCVGDCVLCVVLQVVEYDCCKMVMLYDVGYGSLLFDLVLVLVDVVFVFVEVCVLFVMLCVVVLLGELVVYKMVVFGEEMDMDVMMKGVVYGWLVGMCFMINGDIYVLYCVMLMSWCGDVECWEICNMMDMDYLFYLYGMQFQVIEWVLVGLCMSELFCVWCDIVNVCSGEIVLILVI